METPGLRYLTAEIGRLLTAEAKMIFVAGPRQVGKTTFVRHLLGEAGAEPLYFYFSERLKPRYAVQVVRHPEGFRSTLTTRGVILTPARRIPCAGVMPTSAGERPRRNSLRLEGFDYSQSGEYFVTMCTAGRRCVPGEVEEGRMRLSDTGKIVDACRRRIPEHFPKTRVSTYQIMPNPVHVLRQPTCRSGHIQQLHVHAPAPPHT